MSRDFAFVLGVHHHQPVGNFGWVFEKAFADCYRPFLETLAAHPEVRFTAHYSGPVLEFMRERESGLWDLLGEMAQRGQVELLGGGFYEPILTIIPEDDQRGQLEMMSDFLATHFGRRPRGIWLTERVWEPGLPKVLAAASIEYTLLDEEHLRSAGVSGLHEIHVTEDEGFPLRLLPIDKSLRYLIPFRPLADVAARFEAIRAVGGLAILGDDAEKFGLWPGTKDWVYGRGWLESFLRYLEEKGIPTRTCAEAIEARPPAGRVYLPPASYEEMTEWALRPEAGRRYQAAKASAPAEARRFLRGGYFKEFFLKYPESHHLRMRMIEVSRAVRAADDPEARCELYKGQGNDPYWHGVFGGLYLPHLREAAYGHLLRAESRLPPMPGWREADVDLDGQTEWTRREGRFGLIVKPDAGGALVEIDDRILGRNLSDVLSRHSEPYHAPAKASGSGGSIHELPKALPPGVEDLLRPDRFPRWSCLERLLPTGADVEGVGKGEADDPGGFATGSFEARVEGEDLILDRWAEIPFGEGGPVRIGMRKSIEASGDALRVTVEVRNAGPRPVDSLWISEWNLYQNETEFSVEGSTVRLGEGRLALSFDPGAALRWHPLRTVSQSESGYDIIHQGVCFASAQRIRLVPGASIVSVVLLRAIQAV